MLIIPIKERPVTLNPRMTSCPVPAIHLPHWHHACHDSDVYFIHLHPLNSKSGRLGIKSICSLAHPWLVGIFRKSFEAPVWPGDHFCKYLISKTFMINLSRSIRRYIDTITFIMRVSILVWDFSYLVTADPSNFRYLKSWKLLPKIKWILKTNAGHARWKACQRWHSRFVSFCQGWQNMNLSCSADSSSQLAKLIVLKTWSVKTAWTSFPVT